MSDPKAPIAPDALRYDEVMRQSYHEEWQRTGVDRRDWRDRYPCDSFSEQERR
jgi:hypothetical protein